MTATLNIGIDFGAKNIDVEAGMNDATPVAFSFPAVTSPLEHFRGMTGIYQRQAIMQPFQMMFGETALKSHFSRHSMMKSIYYAANRGEQSNGKSAISLHVQGIFWSAVAEALLRLATPEKAIAVNAAFGIPSCHYKDANLVNMLEKGMLGEETLQYENKAPWRCQVVKFTVETHPYAGGVLTQYISLRDNKYHENVTLAKQRIGVGGIGSFTCDAAIVEPQGETLITTTDESLPRGGLWSVEENWRTVLRREYGGIFDDWSKWQIFALFESGAYNTPGDLDELKREVIRGKIPQIVSFFSSVFGNASDLNQLVFFGRGMLDPTLRQAVFDSFQDAVQSTRGHLKISVAHDDDGREIPERAVANGLYKLAIAIWLSFQQ